MPNAGAAVSWDDGSGGDEPDDHRERRTGAGGGVPGRRTVTIRGQGSERHPAPGSRRRSERRHEREGFRPDRAALWAVILGVMLILVAVTSAHAASL